MGKKSSTLPGLHIAAPPRRVARGRQPDRLVLHLELLGNAPLDRGQQSQLMQRLADQFYKTPGAVTSTLRAAVDDLNQYLLERNLRAASSGQQSLGLLTLLVLPRKPRLSGSVRPDAYLCCITRRHPTSVRPTDCWPRIGDGQNCQPALRPGRPGCR